MELGTIVECGYPRHKFQLISKSYDIETAKLQIFYVFFLYPVLQGRKNLYAT